MREVLSSIAVTLGFLFSITVGGVPDSGLAVSIAVKSMGASNLKLPRLLNEKRDPVFCVDGSKGKPGTCQRRRREVNFVLIGSGEHLPLVAHFPYVHQPDRH